MPAKNMPIHKERLSNLEAMRVFAMLMVLLVHSVFFSCGYPDIDMIVNNPIGTFYYSYVEALALVGVNCFILISGYFGINVKAKSVINVVFIVLFYKLLSMMMAYLCYGHITMTFGEMVVFFVSYSPDWFIYAYLFMLVFVPMMNVYTAQASRRNLAIIIITYVTIEAVALVYKSIFDWSIGGLNFSNGYSTFSFIGLYLIGRYYRLYGETSFKRGKRSVGLAIYMLTALVSTLIYILSGYMGVTVHRLAEAMFTAYSSPFVICASIGVLIFFTSLSFKSRFVNWLGASAFAVYLIHLNPFVVRGYKYIANYIYTTAWPVLWLPLIIVFICAVYLLCTLLDQARIYSWRKLSLFMDFGKSK